MRKIQEYVEFGSLNDLKYYLSLINANTLEQDLVDIITSLSGIASQLDKRTPVVTIEPNRVRIKVSAQELIKDVFSHILRNCVDHGLETTDERVHLEKNVHGAITIRPVVAPDGLTIYVKDDGRGLNITGLFKKGVGLGRWTESDTPDILEVAELMFASGVSTKEVVTDISGRGVGLDAVRQFLAEVGGWITVHFIDNKTKSNGFMDFELVITFPSDLFFEADEAGNPIVTDGPLNQSEEKKYG